MLQQKIPSIRPVHISTHFTTTEMLSISTEEIGGSDGGGGQVCMCVCVCVCGGGGRGVWCLRHY